MKAHVFLPVLLSGMFALASPALADQNTAYVLSTDFQSSGSLGLVDLATYGVVADVATVHSDPRIRMHRGLIYVVNRFGQDNIQIIDPAQGFATIGQFSVGNGSNPQDIAFVSSTKAYVTRLGSPDLLIVNPTTGSTLGTISLAGFADNDGLPEMDRMRLIGRRLFIALERLESFTPTDTSLVAVVDVVADTVVDCNPSRPGIQAIPLAGTNPITKFEFDRRSSRLLIGCAGNFGVLDGGIEWIDPVSLESGGIAVKGSVLGGDVLDVEFFKPGRSFAIVSENFATRLVAFSLETGAVFDTVFAPGGFSLADCEVNDRGELYVCKNLITAPGVFVFDAATGVPLAGPLDMGLPPVEVAFAEADFVDVPQVTATRSSRLSVWPNPARRSIAGRIDLDAAGEISVEVFDIAGRLVRSVASGHRLAGAHDFAWDLNDARGRRVDAGIYLIRTKSVAETWTTRVVTLP